jgi:hypothetical protein
VILAWGSKVSPAFRAKLVQISGVLSIDPSWLAACIAFESGETFSASITNAAGSGAVGLIQFMPSTAAALGTSTRDLALMMPEDQLSYVLRYFRGWTGKMKNLGDVYSVILWPAAVGRADSYVLFDKADALHPKRYLQNHGLDFNQDGHITRGEVISKIVAKLAKGSRPPLVWDGPA